MGPARRDVPRDRGAPRVRGGRTRGSAWATSISPRTCTGRDLLADGAPLSAVTARIAARFGVRDADPARERRPDRDADRLRRTTGPAPALDLHFQEYWVRRRARRRRHGGPLRGGRPRATPAPGCSRRSASADVVVRLPVEPRRVDRADPRGARRSRRPSRPGATGGRRERDRRRGAGRGDGRQADAGRRDRGERGRRRGALRRELVSAWLIDDVDAADAARVEALGLRCRGDRHDHERRRARRGRRSGGAGAASGDARPSWPVEGLPEIAAGRRPGSVLVPRPPGAAGVRDGDVVVVTQKVVSKAEGRLVAERDRDAAVARRDRAGRRPPRRPRDRRDAPRLRLRERRRRRLERRGGVRSRSFPRIRTAAPSGSARARRGARRRASAVVITDTFGRPWREGLVDVGDRGRRHAGRGRPAGHAGPRRAGRSRRRSWRSPTRSPPRRER